MKDHQSLAAPIACTLGTGAYRERLAWIAELNRSALQSVRREGARLILTYDPQASAGVRTMIRREQKCCAFLRFELQEDETTLTLVITAPEETKDSLDTLFDPFLRGEDAGDRCSCGSCAGTTR